VPWLVLLQLVERELRPEEEETIEKQAYRIK
jgi:hypothetical protein